MRRTAIIAAVVACVVLAATLLGSAAAQTPGQFTVYLPLVRQDLARSNPTATASATYGVDFCFFPVRRQGALQEAFAHRKARSEIVLTEIMLYY